MPYRIGWTRVHPFFFLSPQSCKFHLRTTGSRKAHIQYCNNSLCNTVVDAPRKGQCPMAVLEPLGVSMLGWGHLGLCRARSPPCSGSSGFALGRVTAPSTERGEPCPQPLVPLPQRHEQDVADSTRSTHVTCLHGASTASWGEGQGWTWRQRGMCLLCDTNEASGLAVTYTVKTSSSCLQAALIGGITLMPMLAWGCKGRRKKPCPGPEVQGR